MVENKKPFFDPSGSGESSFRETQSSPVMGISTEDDDSPANDDPVLTLDGVETRIADDNDAEVMPDDRLMVGAGVAGGVCGLLLGGPLLATLAGFGAAWATSKQGAAGDVARAMGEVALTARSKAQELDAKHHFTESTKQAASQAVGRMQEYEREHNVVAKTKEFFVFSWTKVSDFNREHRVVQRTFETMSQAVAFVVHKILDTVATSTDENNNTAESTTASYTAVPSAPPSEFDDKTTCDAKPF